MSPLPAGAAHVPSPRQNVLAEALVPLLRFATGKFPVTSADKSTLDILFPVPLALNVLLVSVSVLDAVMYEPRSDMSASTTVIVLLAVLIVLLVRVSVVALPTNVSVASGSVITLAALALSVMVVVTPTPASESNTI